MSNLSSSLQLHLFRLPAPVYIWSSMPVGPLIQFPNESAFKLCHTICQCGCLCKSLCPIHIHVANIFLTGVCGECRGPSLSHPSWDMAARGCRKYRRTAALSCKWKSLVLHEQQPGSCDEFYRPHAARTGRQYVTELRPSSDVFCLPNLSPWVALR
jgi:hypothetical protein